MRYRQGLKPVNHRVIARAWFEMATALSSPPLPQTNVVTLAKVNQRYMNSRQRPGAHENCKWWVMQEQDQQQLTRVADIQKKGKHCIPSKFNDIAITCQYTVEYTLLPREVFFFSFSYHYWYYGYSTSAGQAKKTGQASHNSSSFRHMIKKCMHGR